ncbi:unnamed protein product [Orchesella dallaii]|uniref:Helicase ATP-binding domain-containing protein n=1 Tax=Orchesella dallaii TaxID=48710 RepID=A0ABP1Q0E6_9HEXA
MADDNGVGQGLGGDYENIVFLDGLHPEDDVQLLGEEDENIAPPNDEAQQQDVNESDTDADEQKTRAESCIYNVLKTGRNLLLEHPVKTNRRLDNLSGAISYWDSAKCLEMEQPTKIYYATKRIDELDQVIALLNEMNLANNLLGGPLKVAVLKESNMHINEGETSRLHFRRDELPPRFPFGFQDVLLELAAANDVNTFLDTRRMYENAELIICPQQFIISPTLRQDYGIDLENAVLIFDEGYDMEKLCCSEASISLPTQELDQLVQKLVGLENSLSLPLPRQQEVQQIVQQLESSLTSLSTWIKGRAKLPPTKEDILEALQTPGLKWEQDEYDDLDEKLETLLTSCPNPDNEALYKIRKFLSILKTINVDNQRNLQYYHLKVAKCEAMNPNNNQDTDLALVMTCINPGIIFQAASAHTQTVIIAANCLAPISIFKKDLGVNFEEVLEIKSHEASKDRYLLSYCAVGPNPQQVRLNLDYVSRSDPNVQDAVGKSLLEICEVIPNGVIAVFHTEHLLYPLRERWRKKPNHLTTSIMERLSVAKHEVLCEMDVGDEQSAMAMFEKYRDSSKNKKGALLLAVARGKLWERIKTLKGEEVRAIIHVSVPYAAWDVEDLVVAKRRIICDSNGPEARHRNLEWYNTEAYRIMNQSFSLCVQDRDDWGAVIVLDSRIIGKKNQFDELLPGWVRKEFKQLNFPEMIRGLERLVSSCRETDADDSG